MEKLKALTEQLVNLNDIADDSSKGVREYKLDQGSAFSISLKHNEQIAVAQSWLSADSVFPYHCHENSEEIMVVYSGVVTVVTDEKRVTLKPGDSLHICAKCGHMLHAITDVRFIAITIPPDALTMPKILADGR